MTTTTNKIEHQSNQRIKPVHSIIRLIHFVIDTVFWLTLYLSVAYLLDQYIVRFNSYIVNYTYSIVLALILYLAYYCLLEFYFQRTIGKFLTRTKVVHSNEGEITFSTILKRTMARLIPIDIFYYLFSRKGLHDILSNTRVVKK